MGFSQINTGVQCLKTVGCIKKPYLLRKTGRIAFNIEEINLKEIRNTF